MWKGVGVYVTICLHTIQGYPVPVVIICFCFPIPQSSIPTLYSHLNRQGISVCVCVCVCVRVCVWGKRCPKRRRRGESRERRGWDIFDEGPGAPPVLLLCSSPRPSNSYLWCGAC